MRVRVRERETMASSVVTLKRDKITPYMTCILCNKLLKEAITISLCLHSFCRKCIYEKLSDRGFKSCPLCDIDLGCIPVNKLRPDHNLQNIRANIFPLKRRKTEVLEVPSSSKTKVRSLSSLVSTPIISMQVAHTLPPVTDEVANKGEILPIEWKKSSILKKRRLEEILEGPNKGADYHPSWNLRTEGGRLLLNMACRLVQSTVPHEISNELMTNPLPDICKWMKYHFANLLTSNRPSISHQFEETGLPELKLVDKEAAYMKQCDGLEQNLSILKCGHNAKLKQQAYFYESKLKEQAQQHEAKVKSLENEVVEKRKEIFDQNKQLEQLHDLVKRKDKSIEMLFQLTEDVGTRLKETLTSLDEARGHISEQEEQVKMIPKLQEESHRGGMEEGVKRVVRAVQAASPYVNWDQIHISENTPDEEREALQRAFVEGIITAPSLATQDEDIIVL